MHGHTLCLLRGRTKPTEMLTSGFFAWQLPMELPASGHYSFFRLWEELFKLLHVLNYISPFSSLTLLLATIIPGGSAGVSSSIHPSYRSPGRPRASSGGDGRVIENGVIGSRGGARVRGVMPDHWEQAFSDPGESHYIEWVSRCSLEMCCSVDRPRLAVSPSLQSLC